MAHTDPAFNSELASFKEKEAERVRQWRERKKNMRRLEHTSSASSSYSKEGSLERVKQWRQNRENISQKNSASNSDLATFKERVKQCHQRKTDDDSYESYRKEELERLRKYREKKKELRGENLKQKALDETRSSQTSKRSQQLPSSPQIIPPTRTSINIENTSPSGVISHQSLVEKPPEAKISDGVILVVVKPEILLEATEDREKPEQLEKKPDDSVTSSRSEDVIEDPGVREPLELGSSVLSSETPHDSTASNFDHKQPNTQPMMSSTVASPEMDPLQPESVVIKVEPDIYQEPDLSEGRIQGVEHPENETSQSYCDKCSVAFESKSAYEKHMQNHSKDKPFACKICGTSFKYKWDLENKHMKVHSKVRGFPCQFCKKTYKHLRNLTAHMLTHDKEAPYRCVVCSRRFKTRECLQQHKMKHPDPKFLATAKPKDALDRYELISKAQKFGVQPTAIVCSPDVPNIDHDRGLQEDVESDMIDPPEKESLIPEIITVKAEPMSFQECEEQNEQLQNPSVVSELADDSSATNCTASPAGVPDGERPFPCTICGKAFRYSSNLTTHMRIHKDEKQFQCIVCGNGFNRKDTMLQHMRMHTGEKPFSCKICNNEYTTKWALAQHMKTHADAMPNANIRTFTCDTCGSTFNRKDTLKQHVRSHTGEKPFACKICVNVYRTKWALTLHMRSHEKEEKNFSCEICGEGFSQRSELALHVRFQHVRESRVEVGVSNGDVSNAVHGNTVQNSEDIMMSECPKEDSFRPELIVLKQDPESFQELKQTEEEMDDSTSASHNANSLGQIQPGDPCSPFVCNVCGRDLKYKCLYDRHMISHSSDKPFPCEVCGTKFKSKYDLKKHMKIHESSKPIKCTVCGKQFTYSWNYESHMRTHTGDKPFPCELCGMRFNRKDILEKHVTLHTGEKPYPCKMCDSAFSTNWALVEHTRSHTGEEPYSCEICGKKFKRKGVYDRHVRTQHSKNASDEASEKAKSSQNKDDKNLPESKVVDRSGDEVLKSNEVEAESHTEVAGVDANLDNRSSEDGDAENLRSSKVQTPDPATVSETGNDQKKQQRKDGSQYVCNICNKSYAFKCLLERHLPRHSNEKTVPCEICGTKFKSKYDVQGHMRVHMERKTFSCEICGNRFNRRDSLKVHMKSHTEKKLFTCQVCGQVFGNINNFNNHMQVHSEERPFACDICGNRFIRKDVLDKHLRLHTGEKLFSCTVCDTGFNSRWQLSEHMKIHKVPVLFPCNVCGRNFKRKVVRNRHMRTQHPTTSTDEMATKESPNDAADDDNESSDVDSSKEESDSNELGSVADETSKINHNSQKLDCKTGANPPSPVEILGI
ncbi:hypothetical protein QAD02_018067 [Eretmocerus hayati]|uniref:Uncharacterized protein n=1 Tax=Eretmocerus hayati TaxID=131215 RepID=A0ACC2PKH3_9HYME|nr:hypothetical protein QAD02_018067 [Eretmocerus hayati]